MMTTDGIGSTIRAFKHKQVNTLSSTRAKSNQLSAVLCRSKDSILPDFSQSDNVGEIFFDVGSFLFRGYDTNNPFFQPNLLSADGSASLSVYDFSHCGKYFAYGISLSVRGLVSIIDCLQ